MLDVVLILLLFFAVVATYALFVQKGITVSLPTATSGATHDKGTIITVTQAGDIFLDDRPIPMAEIEPEIRRLTAERPPLQVVFNIDQQVAYNTVIQLLDSVRLGGASNVVLEANAPR
jgi:biopolymer transport protein ExbD